MSQSLQCNLCKHYLGGGACEAFLEGIPAPIRTGDFDHRKAYDGDGGIRWEPADAEANRIAKEMDEEGDG